MDIGKTTLIIVFIALLTMLLIFIILKKRNIDIYKSSVQNKVISYTMFVYLLLLVCLYDIPVKYKVFVFVVSSTVGVLNILAIDKIRNRIRK